MPCSDTHHHNNTTTNNGFGVEENITLSIEELSYHHHHQQNHHSSMETHTTTPLTITTKSTIPIWCQQIGTTIFMESMIRCSNNTTTATSTPYPQPPDLLNFFSLPRCSPSSRLQNSSITFTNPIPKTSNFLSSLESLGDLPSAIDTPQGTVSSVLYDPIFHLNLPPQPLLFRELLQSLPHGYILPGSGNGSLFSSGGDKRKRSG
ncbi:hypothetical protein DVH24_004986 [Malus domestica]|uniref:Uncharacterized protein n=1 Tax=Malus domestica TaxID=3750 RepID=A0A498IFZ1_MALDO|nr:hypothetical protein DVH24_004986 [Malus domestica]